MDKKIEKKIWTWQRISLGIIGIAAIAWLGTAIFRSSGTSRLNVEMERLLLDTVHRGVFQEYIPVSGTVLPVRNVVITAIEGGKVEEKFVEDGAIVSIAQQILRLSNPDLQLSYLNQEAAIVSQINSIQSNSLFREQQTLNLQESALEVDARIAILGKRYERNKLLAKDKVISQVEFEESEDEYQGLLRRKELLKKTLRKDSMANNIQDQQMENTLSLMKRNLEISKQSLDNLIVKAPINGQLSGLTVELGESIVKGSQIAQIDDLSNFKIRVRMDEFYISRVFPEQEGGFDFAGQSYRLKIVKIYPQVINGAFEADMLFIGKFPSAIKRGQTLSVKLELSAQEEALLLARGGFYQATGGNWVYVLQAGGNVARKRSIRINRQNPNYYEITEGLAAGDVVITSSYDNYGDKDELILK